MSPAVLAATAAGCALLAAVLLLVGSRRARRSAAERSALEDGLRRSQEQVDVLARRLEDLTVEVQSARRATASAATDREYVITTLAEAAQTTRADLPVERATAPIDVEQRLVDGLGRLDARTTLGRRATEAAVSVLAAAHGVRRALQPEHLDRAAAEAHVARRRSRRLRRQELREAKRLLRAVKAQQPVRPSEESAA